MSKWISKFLAAENSGAGEKTALRWDDDKQLLWGWTSVQGQPVFLRIPRQMIHDRLAIYNDAVGWEIERFKHDIVERLASEPLSREAAE